MEDEYEAFFLENYKRVWQKNTALILVASTCAFLYFVISYPQLSRDSLSMYSDLAKGNITLANIDSSNACPAGWFW
jgi:hypothetical protein